MRSILFSIFLLFVGVVSTAQNKSNRGKEFWLGYGNNYKFMYETPINDQELALYISTELAATVTVTINGTAYAQTLTIPANTVNATILIPKTGPNDARVLTDGFSNKGIHIVSDVPVAVYAHVYGPLVSGATMLMPVDTYGYTYYSINYYQTTSQSSPDGWYSWAYVIASEDNTRVEITPSDTTKNGWLPGQTYTVNLNKGEMYHIFGKAIFDGNAANASKDMTGSKFVSVIGADGNCHPMAVFSGSSGIRLCRGDGGEYMHQQVFPSQAWGTRYLTYHTINNTNTDILETNRNYYRVCVLDPTTVVKKNGVTMTGLIRNFYYEYLDSTGGDYITADKPIMVAQYMPNKNQCWNFPTTNPSPPSYGDPEMFYLSPIEQGQKSVLFYVSRKSTIDYVYANIHFPTNAQSSLLVDGAAVPASQIIPHPNLPSYSVALVRFIGPAAQHRITCDSTFNATVYGLGNYESYGYNVGTLINNLNNYSAIANTNNTNGLVDTFTCRNTPLKPIVKLAFPATTITWKLSQVTGITPNTDVTITNPVAIGTELINGRTYYVYALAQDVSLANIGIFNVPVTYTATVIQNCSQTEFASVKIDVRQGPVANFTYPATPCLQDAITFTGTTNAGIFNITGYNWLFDDNTTTNTVNAVKQFTTDGNHPVRYRVIADNGCFADTIKTVTILPQPIAKLGVQALSFCSSDSAYISDTSIVAMGNITNWYYDFSDGTTLNRNNATPFYHQFNAPGTYEIKLVVTSTLGCKSDTARKTINVLSSPKSKFGFSGNVCVGQGIVFSDSSYTLSNNITQWEWNYGNTVAEVKTNFLPFTYNYTNVGSYNVSLVTVAANGCKSDTFKLPVVVTSKPSAAFTFTGIKCADSTITFTSNPPFNSNTPTNWYWNFGDNQIANITTTNLATHSYAPSNNILVKHVVTTGGCVSDTVSNTISIINANPTANFSINSDTLCENKPVLFIGTASADVNSWQWNFGNGIGNNIPPFTRVYNTANDYAVTLTVKNAAGCSITLPAQQLRIAVVPRIDAGPDIYLPLGASKVINATINNANNYIYSWSPNTFLNAPNILQPTTNATNEILYTVKAIDVSNNCIGIDSVRVKPITNIYVPNAFTPNADGKNDTWKIPALEGYPNCSVIIFNRYGQKIFQATKGYAKPWDGTFKGLQQPMGAYVYFIDPGDNTTKPIKGTVTLIR
ncbi:PKD domain-containing protein [Ferruginibacter yonginensis]|uniref:PKD domain-containing protein n=1 Tax=Ferruginibacter yonginensis TaxID=1310416 RepID=A0ABV8QVG7_9BACT